VRQEVAEGAAFAEPQARQVLRRRGIEVDQAVVDELHLEGCREELDDGADLKEAVNGGLYARFDVEDTESELPTATGW
jgi:hypothetical protein